MYKCDFLVIMAMFIESFHITIYCIYHEAITTNSSQLTSFYQAAATFSFTFSSSACAIVQKNVRLRAQFLGIRSPR